MIVHSWGEVQYIKARQMMQDIHTKALADKQNHLILCSHPEVFTKGYDENKLFDIDVLQSDRGGSVTCHSRGQNIYYFCFQVGQAALFYKKVLNAFEDFFIQYLADVKYEKKNPGFYIQNRKIASLGFRYSQGVSLHGVALNVDVNLAFHAQIPPCNLRGITPTSLVNEGLKLSEDAVNKEIIRYIQKSFNDV